MYYILSALAFGDVIGQEGLSFGTLYLKVMMEMGLYVVGLFACVFLFYTHAFLTKGRPAGVRALQHPGHGKAAYRPDDALRNPVRLSDQPGRRGGGGRAAVQAAGAVCPALMRMEGDAA